MSTLSNKSDETKRPPTSSTVILLLGDIADTTWRMFVPILLFLGLGFWGDTAWHTKPWLMIVGIVVGVGLAALLVRAQFRKIGRDSK